MKIYDSETFLKKRKKFLDGVVVSGGEPTLQNDLEDFIRKVKELGYKVKLDTNGSNFEVLKGLVSKKLVDYVAMDIKAPLNAEHYTRAVGGINQFEKAMQSLDMLIKSGKDFECRTTCDPRVLSIENIYTIADELKARGVKEYYLQRYRQVDGDTTPDSECDKFFEDKELLSYLKSNFETFDIRK